MVTQQCCARMEKNTFFPREKKIRFLSAFKLIKCLTQIKWHIHCSLRAHLFLSNHLLYVPCIWPKVLLFMKMTHWIPFDDMTHLRVCARYTMPAIWPERDSYVDSRFRPHTHTYSFQYSLSLFPTFTHTNTHFTLLSKDISLSFYPLLSMSLFLILYGNILYIFSLSLAISNQAFLTWHVWSRGIIQDLHD